MRPRRLMHHPARLRIVPHVDVLRVPVCSACDVPLDLCQPIVHEPERLLGACPACRLWYTVTTELLPAVTD